MHRYNHSNVYSYYSYLPPTSSRTSRNPSAQNSHYQYYDYRRRPQVNPYEYQYFAATPTHSVTPRQYQSGSYSTTTLADLSEPLSIFDEIRSTDFRRTPRTPLPLPSIYVPPNPSRRTSTNDMRLENASAFREQLLTDIQETIGEIDRELRSLGPTPTPFISQSVPPRQNSSFRVKKEPNSSQSQLWPSKPKRAYQVVPRRANESNQVSRQSSLHIAEELPARHSTPKVKDLLASQLFLGQYHYGPEADEIEIIGSDPENIERTSMTVDMPDLSFYGVSSTNQFLREPSMLSQHRATFSVPQFGSNLDVGTDEWTEDLLRKDSLDLKTIRPSTVRVLHDFPSTDKVNIRDLQSLIQTAPERKIPTPVEPSLVNSIISKPVKHARLPAAALSSKVSSSQATMAGPDKEQGTGYFFSDFGEDGDMDDDLIVIDPSNFALTNESDVLRPQQPSKNTL